jgi:hypothetical protein
MKRIKKTEQTSEKWGVSLGYQHTLSGHIEWEDK